MRLPLSGIVLFIGLMLTLKGNIFRFRSPIRTCARRIPLSISLRGEEPLVRLHLSVLPEPTAAAVGLSLPAAPLPSSAAASSSNHSAGGGPAASTSTAGEGAPSSSLSSSTLTKRSISLGGSGAEPPAGLKRAVLSKLGLCGKTPEVSDERSDSGEGSEWAEGGGISMAGSGRPKPRSPRLVSVRFEVAGGVNLALLTSPVKKSRRTPSSEAITQVGMFSRGFSRGLSHISLQ